MFNKEEISGFLQRLQIENAEKYEGIALLNTIHLQHSKLVAIENPDIIPGKYPSLTPAALFDKIVLQKKRRVLL